MYAALDVPRDGSDEPHIVWIALADDERGAVVYRHPSGTTKVLTAPGVVTATRPAVAVDQTGTVVVVCWYNRDVQDQSLRYRRSIDGGVSWEDECVLWQETIVPLMSFPSIEFGPDGTLHATWSHYFDGNIYFWHRRSTDHGAT